jgi:hypothetical protein
VAGIRPPRAAESKGRQNEYLNCQNVIFAPKKKSLNYSDKTKENSTNKWDFLKLIMSVTGDHCDYSPWSPIHVAAPLFFIDAAVKTSNLSLKKVV